MSSNVMIYIESNAFSDMCFACFQTVKRRRSWISLINMNDIMKGWFVVFFMVSLGSLIKSDQIYTHEVCVVNASLHSVVNKQSNTAL